MMKRTTSSDSWEFPWGPSKRKNRPLVVPPSQSGRNVDAVCFLLCFVSVLLLSSGLCLIGVSIWSLIRKIPYHYLLDIKIDIPYFAIPAGFLCLPSFWIAASIHNTKNRHQFVHLLVLILFISVTLLITGSSMGMMYVSKINDTDRHLVSFSNNEELNGSLYMSFKQYNTSSSYRYAWDRTQKQLKCCGILNSDDWTRSGQRIPSSCCLNEICSSDKIFSRGCLDNLSRELLWHKNVLSSHCYIMTVMQVVVALITIAVYFSKKSR